MAKDVVLDENGKIVPVKFAGRGKTELQIAQGKIVVLEARIAELEEAAKGGELEIVKKENKKISKKLVVAEEDLKSASKQLAKLQKPKTK